MSRAWKLAFIVSLAVLVSLSVTPAGAGEQAPTLDALLAQVPQSAYNGWLAYADLDVLLAGYGAAWPENAEAFSALSGTAEERAVVAAFMAVSAGPSDFFRNLYKARETLASSGIDFFFVRRALEIGSPPMQQIWLSGTFQPEPIRHTLAEKGYLQVNTGIAGRETWAAGGDLASGMKMDLKSRDPNFLFGGNLGQKWPVALMPGLLASTRDEAGIRAIGLREGPFLSENAAFADSLHALREGGGEIAQLYLLTPEAAGLSGAGALPRFALMALAHVFTQDAQQVVLALCYPDADGAAQATQMVSNRLAGEIALPSGDTLQGMVEERGGAAQAVQTVAAPGGSHIVSVAFRFPLPPAQDDPLPYRLFVHLLMRRELGWLGTLPE